MTNHNLTLNEEQTLLLILEVNGVNSPVWRLACDKLKERRNGQWPPDWWTKIGSKLPSLRVE